MATAECQIATAECRTPDGEIRMLTAEWSSGTRRKAVWGSRVKVAIAVTLSIAALFALTSCSDAIRTGQSPSYLILQSLTGGAQNSAVVQSDVLSDTGTILQDNGSATLQVVLKDPLGSTPTPVNAITITQYHVEYVRADGHNVQGVDVPFAFDGGVTSTIQAGATGSVNFTLVRVQAKLEAPLKALEHKGGQIVISTTAHVTFYGHDQNGRDVSVEGDIEVDFADWAG
ncbi:MAG TPA: hypothetical protein VFZ98_01235 [Vicinamibacterales bacterium]